MADTKRPLSEEQDSACIEFADAYLTTPESLPAIERYYFASLILIAARLTTLTDKVADLERVIFQVSGREKL